MKTISPLKIYPNQSNSDYILITFWLISDFILTSFWLHSDFILTTFWLHSDYILTTFWLYSEYTLATFWLYCGYILATFCLHSGCGKFWEILGNFATIYALSCEEKLSPKSTFVEKNDKYEACKEGGTRAGHNNKRNFERRQSVEEAVYGRGASSNSHRSSTSQSSWLQCLLVKTLPTKQTCRHA